MDASAHAAKSGVLTVNLLLGSEDISRRRRAADGDLALLRDSLSRDLDRVLENAPPMPAEKALLSREGGRCTSDGAALEFDPWSPDRHRCTRCGRSHGGERHYLWWVTWQQLWLAERAVHAAVLRALADHERAGIFANDYLASAADRYLSYPNRDNVLGPSRPFFSTYLESIWLLQLCIALDLLESCHAARPGMGDRVRELVIAPSASLIASFNEGSSNRQVWNSTALFAAGVMLDRATLVKDAVGGRGGLLDLLSGALLPDGSWYEGENYHLFAHRGLWYGVIMAQQHDIPLPEPLLMRFREGFALPLLTALPDWTFPARRDAQYGVSLRQWRFAESLELGIAFCHDERLAAALYELYDFHGARGDTGRWRSTAEAERNEPPSKLSRADLGWRSLLFAREQLPHASHWIAGSVLLESQGLAVLRPRDSVYASLDYGHPGGGHGHPDRLNIILAHGADRWLDDPGTGSYVDPSLFWYRSTLAHNAPLVDGHSQRPSSGELLAFEARDGWARAEAVLRRESVAAGAGFRRQLITTPDYLLEITSWDADAGHVIDLPFHVGYNAARSADWRSAAVEGSSAPSDGFAFIGDTQIADVGSGALMLELRNDDRTGHAALLANVSDSGACHWWRARTPGSPGSTSGGLIAFRTRCRTGKLISAWSWSGRIDSLQVSGEGIVIGLEGGRRDEHMTSGTSWLIRSTTGSTRTAVELDGMRSLPAPAASNTSVPSSARPVREPIRLSPSSPFRRELGAASYRRSEESWEEAGSPKATVVVRLESGAILVNVEVRKRPLVFRRAEDDQGLDNESADIHGDGVQIHLLAGGAGTADAWLLVPDAETGAVRIRHAAGAQRSAGPRAGWERRDDGYDMRIELPLSAVGMPGHRLFALDVLVNETAPGRQRRRGQLVLSGGAGEFVYLRGDRQPVERLLRFEVVSD